VNQISESEFVARANQSGLPGHRESLPRKPCTPARKAIECLIPPPISRVALLALFDNRATIDSIKNWRYGRSRPPQWAIDILRSKLNAKAAVIAALGTKLEPSTGMGWNKGVKTLAVWREREARKREEARLASLQSEFNQQQKH
jgi:hypothetical protein